MFATAQCPTSKACSTPLALLVDRDHSGRQNLQSSPTEQMDTRLRDDLIASHLNLVRLIARRFRARLPRHVELSELVAAGNLGLVDAASRFDETKQVQFRTFAQFRIRGAMLDFLRQIDWSPRVLRKQGRALEDVIRVLQERGVRAPDENDIARELGMPLATYQRLAQDLHLLEMRSLNENRSESAQDEDASSLPGPETDDPLLRCLEGEERKQLIAALDLLPERGRVLLSLYYYEELTMKQIALVLSLSESRVSQLHCLAISQMRAVLGSMGGSNAVIAARNTHLDFLV